MVKDFVFYLPIKIVFGSGKFNTAGEEAAKLGVKAFIVTGKRNAELSGLLERLTGMLAKKNIRWVHFNGVKPNPTTAVVDEASELARRENCDFVIGLGGGSVLDTAKAVALSAKSGLPIWRHAAIWTKDYIEPKEALPVMAIETLAGTSSDSDNIAVITNEKTGEKPGFSSSLIFPKVAIVDPEVMISVPPRMTAITGFDILCHTMEGYVTKVSHPIAAILNLHAIEIIVNYLPAAVRDGSNMDARSNLAFANVIAGFSLTHSKAALLHAMEHPLSGHFNVTHAEGLAALMPKWIEFSWDGNRKAFMDIGTKFGLNPEENTKENLVSAVRTFLKGIGLDISLSKLGVKRESFRKIAGDALHYMAGGVANNPVVATEEDIVRLLEESM